LTRGLGWVGSVMGREFLFLVGWVGSWVGSEMAEMHRRVSGLTYSFLLKICSLVHHYIVCLKYIFFAQTVYVYCVS